MGGAATGCAASVAAPAGRCGGPWSGWLAVLAVCALVGGATAWLYAGSLDNGFADDDFALLNQARSRDVAAILADDFGARSAPFWRPGWRLLFRAGWLCFGDHERAWFLTCIGLHAGLAVSLVLALGRRVGWAAAGLAGLLYGLGSAHVEAVLWPAAALNVLPAALCLLCGGLWLWRWAEGAGWRWYGAGLLAFLASLWFREAAYHLPLVLVAGVLCLRDANGCRRSWRESAVALAPFAVLMVAHYLFLNRKSATRLSLFESIELLVGCAGAYAQALLAWPGSGGSALVALLLGAAVLLWFGDRRTRAGALWALAALFPYALMDYASRLAAFGALGSAVALGYAAGRAQPRRWLRWLAAAAGLALLGGHLFRHPAAQRELRDRGEICRAIERSCAEQRLHEQPYLVLDRLPTVLRNSFRDLLELRLGKAPPVVEMLLLPRPPLVLYVGVSPESVPADAMVVHYEAAPDPRQHRLVPVPRGALAPGLVPVPPFAITPEYEVFADAAAARRAIETGALDPRRSTAVVGPLPEPAPSRPQAGRVWGVHLEDRVVTAEVEAPAAALLAVCHFVDLVGAPAAVAIDGENVPILQANGVANAVLVPAGRHQVQVKFLVR